MKRYIVFIFLKIVEILSPVAVYLGIAYLGYTRAFSHAFVYVNNFLVEYIPNSLLLVNQGPLLHETLPPKSELWYGITNFGWALFELVGLVILIVIEAYPIFVVITLLYVLYDKSESITRYTLRLILMFIDWNWKLTDKILGEDNENK